MTAIWSNDGTGWKIMAPAGFPDEAALHTLVEEAPELLPLSGEPRIVVLGREVRLGSGIADLVGMEPSGRPVIIEVKLARNEEARRAVVTQVLTYAAVLYGLRVEEFERLVEPHLRKRDAASVLDAMANADQTGSFDATSFAEQLRDSLLSGRFRLVLVLDDAPAELIRLVGYLQAVSDHLVIDLVTVAAYEVGRSRLLVPQRVEPERQRAALSAPPVRDAQKGWSIEGGADFAASIQSLPEIQRLEAERLYGWAAGLERDGVATLLSYHAAGGGLLLSVYVVGEQASLVTIWGSGAVSMFRTVFERRAPSSIAAVELAIGKAIRQGNQVKPATDEFLASVRAAYEEAANGSLSGPVLRLEGQS